jgi:hypothetical protein
MTDTKQPETLRLADALVCTSVIYPRAQAAAELRRLHEENETLKKCLFQMQNAAIELAKPEQEPIGWFLKDHLETYMESYKDIEGAIPLYTSPPRKEWVGLSVNEGRDFFESKLTRAELIAEISEFLEEKNNAV